MTITGTSDGDQYTLYSMHRSVALRMGNVSGKRYTENQNLFCVEYFVFENRAVCEIMWNNIADRGRTHMTIKHAACALHAGYRRLKNTHKQCVIYCLPTASVVTRMRLSIALKLRCCLAHFLSACLSRYVSCCHFNRTPTHEVECHRQINETCHLKQRHHSTSSCLPIFCLFVLFLLS